MTGKTCPHKTGNLRQDLGAYATICAIRKKFPKVVKLDGHELPPQITFDVDSTASPLPVSQGSRFPNPEVEALLCTFLKQYYNVFDSDNRQPLLDAYHDNAVFSLCTAYNSAIQHKQPGFCYMESSRNISKIHGSSKQDKLNNMLKTSKLGVVAALEKFPKTRHDPNLFRVDVALATPTIYQFTVTGVFMEVGNSTGRDPVRTFSRCFITVPCGTGICIINEQFSVTNATEGLVKKAFTSESTPTASKAIASPQPQQATPTNGVAAAAGLTELQKQMVVEFSKNSNMNEEFSIKCLSECGWDFNRAAVAFTEAKAKNAIPPQAFIN